MAVPTEYRLAPLGFIGSPPTTASICGRPEFFMGMACSQLNSAQYARSWIQLSSGI
jgi:hypothetical protein